MKKKVLATILFVAFTVMLITAMFVGGILTTHYVDEIKGDIERKCMDVELIYDYNGIDGVSAVSESTYHRVTLIRNDGVVLYDNVVDADKLENHNNRPEFIEAVQDGMGQSTRYSDTISTRTYYFAIQVDDGNVLRVSRTVDSVWGVWLSSFGSILLTLIVISAVAIFLSKRITNNLIEPINNLNLEKPLSNNTYEELSPLLVRMARQKKELSKNMRKIHLQEMELNNVVENMEEGIVIISAKGVISILNKSIMRNFHCNVGDSYLSISRAPEFVALVEKGLVGANGSVTLEVNKKNLLMTSSSTQDDEGNHSLVILAIDVTEKEKNEKIRREFSANVSHELKTPLTSIMGYSELIEMGIAKAEDTKPFASKISQEARRLLMLIEDIMELSRLEETGAMEESSEVDVNLVSEEVVASLKEKAKKKNISIQTTMEQCVILGSSHKVFEIIYNLVDNAINYNKEGGYVNLIVKKEDSRVVISVEDNGIGIPDKSQDRVFERFYRVDKSRSKDTGGTGLGLAIVKHITETMGGYITLESKVGVGTKITAIFPAVEVVK